MTIRIDLPIHTLEEAKLLDKVLLDAADHRKACRKLIHTTQEEARVLDTEFSMLLDLRERMLGRAT